MFIAGIAIGIVVGAGGYYLYERVFSSAYTLGKNLLAAARGDIAKAQAHIGKLL